jgi:hypothetical protein
MTATELDEIRQRVKRAVSEVHTGTGAEADEIIDAVIVSLFKALAEHSQRNRTLYLLLAGALRQ